MRIACPYCGDRSNAEFTYLGDAAPTRPEGKAGEASAFFDYVYIRDNPPGALREWWQHSAGCRAWLAVERNATTHEISVVVPAPGAAARGGVAGHHAGEASR